MSFTQVITSVGLAKIAAALGGGPLVNITEIAVGDVATVPIPALTNLGNEVWRGNVNLVAEATPDRVRVEGIIPADEAGGYTLREAGAFDYDKDLILVARIPDTYKPDIAADGASVVAYLRLNVEIANAATALELTVDPSTVLATKQYADSLVVPLTLHLDGGASKHDATEVVDEAFPGDYHGAHVQDTLDHLNDGLVDHENADPGKHAADQITDSAVGGTEVQAALDHLRARVYAAGDVRHGAGALTWATKTATGWNTSQGGAAGSDPALAWIGPGRWILYVDPAITDMTQIVIQITPIGKLATGPIAWGWYEDIQVRNVGGVGDIEISFWDAIGVPVDPEGCHVLIMDPIG